MGPESEHKRRLHDKLRRLPGCLAIETLLAGHWKPLHGSGRYKGVNRDVPDTMVIWTGGLVFFIEHKTEEGDESPGQTAWRTRMTSHGHLVIVGPQTVAEILQAVKEHQRK